MADLRNEFQDILNGLDTLQHSASQMRPPNQEDDIFIRAAILGFSRHAPMASWTLDHFSYISNLRSEDLSYTELTPMYGHNPQVAAIFGCVCIGAMLGLYQSNKITDNQFQVALAQLPGFMLLNSNKLQAPAA